MMSSSKNVTLDDAIEAVQSLPEDAQVALAEELVALVEDYESPGLTDAQRKIVNDRLAKPLKAVPRDNLIAMLRRYNPMIEGLGTVEAASALCSPSLPALGFSAP